MTKIINDLNELIQAVKTKLPDYLTDMCEIPDPHKKFPCVSKDHKDNNPSMSLGKDGMFIKCFSCNRAYDIFSLAHEYEGMPLDGDGFIKDCVFKLADRYHIKYSILSTGNEKTAFRQAYFRAYKIVAEYLQTITTDKPTEAYKAEIKKRKWKNDKISIKESIDLGVVCASSNNDIQKMLKDNGFTKEFVEMIGLSRADLFSIDNVLFTIYDEYKHPIAFYARDTAFEVKKEKYDNRDKMELSKVYMPSKYNSTANYTGIYEKSLVPYGINDVKNFHKVIAVEGHGCKHSLRLNGVDNVIALGGLGLNDTTLDKLRSLGVTNVVLMLDNDDKGREKTKNVIRQFYGKNPIDFSVLDMASLYSDVKDPDEFVRKYGIEPFKTLPERNALEWIVITELYEKGDPYVVLQDIIPLIALERSPINRRKIEAVIADMTGLDKQDIHDEVEQKITVSKDRKGEVALRVLDEARDLLITNPGAYDAVRNVIDTKFGALNKGDDSEDLYSGNEVMKELARMEEFEDAGVEAPTIKTGFLEFDRLLQLPTEEAFCLIPASPNSGKSTLCLNLVSGILENSPNCMCIIHTIDDSRSVYFNRLVASKAKIKMNWCKLPQYYLDEELAARRKEAYRDLTEYIRDDRLIIKDCTHGDTVEYHGKLVQHYRDKYPNRNIFVVMDNLHRLGTEMGYDDSRLKSKYISSRMKDYTTKYGCVEWCTVEMNKMRMYERHTNPETISEAGSLQFDANLIMFLWNEVNALREEALLTFDSTIMDYHPGENGGYIHKPVPKPIIEALVLKNKVSEYKGSLWFKFHPELAIYDNINYQEVKEILDARAAEATK